MFSSCLPGAPLSRPTLYTYLARQSVSCSGLSSSSNAEDVSKLYSQQARGKVFYVTGATSEIARELCTSLVRHGATVVMGHRGDDEAGARLADGIMAAARMGCASATMPSEDAPTDTAPPTSNQAAASNARDTDGCEATGSAALKEASQSNILYGTAMAVKCDLTSCASAAAAADAFMATQLPLHGLIHCAGTVLGSFSTSPDGVESHFAVNALNPLLLTLLLLPHMATSVGGYMQGSSPASCQPVPAQLMSSAPAAAGLRLCVPRVVWAACSAHHIAYLPLRRGTGRQISWHVADDMAQRMFAAPQAFGSSKLASMLAARELAIRAAAVKLPLATFCAHPGITGDGLKRYGGTTEGSVAHMLKTVFADGIRAMGALKTPAQAAATLAYALLVPLYEQPLPDAGQPSEAGADEVRVWLQGRAAPATEQLVGSKDEDASKSVSHAPDAGDASDVLEPHTSAASQVNNPQPLHAYLEDCARSQPSPLARSEIEAAALYELCLEMLWPHLQDKAAANWLGPAFMPPLARAHYGAQQYNNERL